MTRISLIAAAFALLASSGTALAQPVPAGSSDVKKGPIAKPQPPEIVHGFYSEFDFGVMKLLGGDAGKNTQGGVMAGFALGADVGKYLRVEGRMLNSTSDSSGTVYKDANVTNNPAYPCADGSTAACISYPDVQVSLVTADVKAVYPVSDRLNVHALVGGGVMLGNPAPSQMFKFDQNAQIEKPKTVESGNAPAFGAGAGLEYYTHLRHFSVGGDLAIWSVSGGLALTIFPTVKYTF